MKRLSLGWPHLAIVVLYFVLFAQFPVRGHLPGNSDTLLAIALTNLFNEMVGLFVRGLPIDTVMYPTKNILAYGENCFGLGFIFTAFKLPTQSDRWAYFLFLVTIFSLNSFALFSFAKEFTRKTSVAWVASLTLPLSNFCLANIDDANVVFVFFPVMALVHMRRGLLEKSSTHLGKALLYSSFQIWFGMYVFLFQALALALFTLVYFRRLKDIVVESGGLRELGRLAACYVLPAAPIFALYLWNHFQAAIVSPYDVGVSRRLSSLTIYDFTNVLPGNLLYSSQTNIFVEGGGISPWYAVRRYCFPGLLLPVLVFFGLFRAFKSRDTMRYFFVAIIVVFVSLAFGRNLFAYDSIEALPLGTYFRVASRAYLFALIPFTAFFAIGLEGLIDRWSRRPKWSSVAIPIGVALVFIVENVPFPMPSYDYDGMLEPVDSYVKFFDRFPERQVVLDLPSTYKSFLPQDGSLWTYSRDALYMNWQTYHKQIIVGGINGYTPKSRIEVEAIFEKLPSMEAIEGLMKYGIRFVVCHKKYVLQSQDFVIERFETADGMKLEYSDEDVAIYRLIGRSPAN